MVVMKKMSKGFVKKFFNPLSKAPKVTVSQEVKREGFTFRRKFTGRIIHVAKKNPEKKARQLVASGKYREVEFRD